MQITELASKLQVLGLNDKEARVYVAALFLGPSSVQRIAEQADINRPTAYVILDQLATYGLMSQSTENRKTVYVAEGPEALDRWLENEKSRIDQKREELDRLIPELQQTERPMQDGDIPTVRFFKGTDIGIMNGYLRRKARPGSTLYSFTNIDDVLKVNPNVFNTNPTARLKKKIASKLIYSYSDGQVPTDRERLRTSKKISTSIAAEINLYEESVDITTYDFDGRNAIIIESKSVAKALRQIFDLAWQGVDISENIDKKRQ